MPLSFLHLKEHIKQQQKKYSEEQQDENTEECLPCKYGDGPLQLVEEMAERGDLRKDTQNA